ncbi:hypothetical protein GCM10010347_41400 [Streptomyces cirratus]|uniref:Uncharacterized protein n=1 Tax=Streptomyces cirratus TaxID=68187 RepID=A0ABQ3EVU8_9ACTN|nr:hypothetical protein [Streptomyces cirratus]GHB67043.1 hypothetical protein GCM10010347_41400 [Streptomyces cirratus]
MTDELRHLLRESAEAHRPDRASMLARVERGTARPQPLGRPPHRERGGALSWPKVVLATLATTGALAVGGFAVVAVVRAPDPPQTTIATDAGTPTPAPPSPAGTPSAAAPSAPAAPESSRTPAGPTTGGPSASGSASSGPRPTPPADGARTSDGPLWADGSVDPHSNAYWAQSNVTLKTRSPLSALTVELRIALGGGVKTTGSWLTRPAADFDVSVREEGRFLVYRWTLKPGKTVPAGQHVFAGQYNHATGGRDAKDDGYRAEAVTPAGKAAVWGDFARTG